jgi:hypothetical protein
MARKNRCFGRCGLLFLGVVGHGGGFFSWDLTRPLVRSRSGGRSGALDDLKINCDRGNTRLQDKRKD